MSQQEFDNLWADAIGEVEGRDEVVVGSDGHTGQRTVKSTSLARISLSCQVRRSIRQTLADNIGKLALMILILASGGYGKLRIEGNRKTETQAKELAKMALGKLAEQASLHAYDPQNFPESYIGMGNLRDDVLRDEFSASRRTKLWEK
ncbi:hypothetical protein LTS18_002269, partial [Coniosporium uncinatum]